MNMLIIDTIGSVASGDENDSKKGTRVIENMNMMVQTRIPQDFAVICIAHTCKGGSHGTWNANKGKTVTPGQIGQIRGTGGQAALCRAAHSVTYAGGDPAHKNKRILWNVRNSFRTDGLADPICFEKGEDGVIKEVPMVPLFQPAAKEEPTEEKKKEIQLLKSRPVDHFLREILVSPKAPCEIKESLVKPVVNKLGFNAETEYNHLQANRNSFVPITKIAPTKGSKARKTWKWVLAEKCNSLSPLPTPDRVKVKEAVKMVKGDTPDGSSSSSSDSSDSSDSDRV